MNDHAGQYAMAAVVVAIGSRSIPMTLHAGKLEHWSSSGRGAAGTAPSGLRDVFAGWYLVGRGMSIDISNGDVGLGFDIESGTAAGREYDQLKVELDERVWLRILVPARAQEEPR